MGFGRKQADRPRPLPEHARTADRGLSVAERLTLRFATPQAPGHALRTSCDTRSRDTPSTVAVSLMERPAARHPVASSRVFRVASRRASSAARACALTCCAGAPSPPGWRLRRRPRCCSHRCRATSPRNGAADRRRARATAVRAVETIAGARTVRTSQPSSRRSARHARRQDLRGVPRGAQAIPTRAVRPARRSTSSGSDHRRG